MSGLTREQVDRLTSFAHADDGERAAPYALLDERDAAERGAKALRLELDAVRERCDEYKREVERRDELLHGADADLDAARAERDEAQRWLKLYKGDTVGSLRDEFERDCAMLRGLNNQQHDELVALRAELAKVTAQRDDLMQRWCGAQGERDALKDKYEAAQGGWAAARATAALHEKALETVTAERDALKDVMSRKVEDVLASGFRSASEQLHVMLEAARDRVAMLTDAARSVVGMLRRPKNQHSNGEAAATILDTALAAPDEGVTEWLEGVRAEARATERAKCDVEWNEATAFAAQPKTPTMLEIIAAHDAQVEAQALEKAARHFEGDGTGLARNAIARELRSLAGKDGTT